MGETTPAPLAGTKRVVSVLLPSMQQPLQILLQPAGDHTGGKVCQVANSMRAGTLWFHFTHLRRRDFRFDVHTDIGRVWIA